MFPNSFFLSNYCSVPLRPTESWSPVNEGQIDRPSSGSQQGTHLLPRLHQSDRDLPKQVPGLRAGRRHPWGSWAMTELKAPGQPKWEALSPAPIPQTQMTCHSAPCHQTPSLLRREEETLIKDPQRGSLVKCSWSLLHPKENNFEEK